MPSAKHKGKLITEDAASTQQFVEIEELKDDVIVLKNRGLRAVLMTSSVNFDLKSQEEKDALIYRYQAFLNSLDFPLQIVMNSRRLNIEPYLDTLREKLAGQTNELLRIQTAEYIDFVQSLVRLTNVMTKSFYVVLPFSPIESKEAGALEKIMEAVTGAKKTGEKEKKEEKFQNYKDQLLQRIDHVIMGLRGVEVRAVALTSAELTELLYLLYNPAETEKGMKVAEPGGVL